MFSEDCKAMIISAWGKWQKTDVKSISRFHKKTASIPFATAFSDNGRVVFQLWVHLSYLKMYLR